MQARLPSGTDAIPDRDVPIGRDGGSATPTIFIGRANGSADARRLGVQTRFVLLAAGDSPDLYQQAHGACLSLLGYAPSDSEIVVFTTRPDRFRWLAPMIRIEEIQPEQLRAWQGPRDYFYRAKFEAVRRAAALGPCHLVLLDADILVTRSLEPLIAALERGACVMHAAEKTLQGRKATRVALQKVFGRCFAETPIGAKTMVFNSGVVGIPASRRDLVERAMRCNDALLEAGVHYFAVEQVAWSAVLGASGKLELALPFVLHYWGNKRAFVKAINELLADALISGWTPGEAAAHLTRRPLDLPLRRRDRWWHPWVASLLKIPIS